MIVAITSTSSLESESRAVCNTALLDAFYIVTLVFSLGE